MSIKNLDSFQLESTPPRHIPLTAADRLVILDKYNTVKILARVLYLNTVIIAWQQKLCGSIVYQRWLEIFK